MAFLFIAFALAMAAGTFIENDYNITTARKIIYNAWWFEAIMVLFVINFIGNIKRYQLLKKENWATLLLHLSWIFIIIGAMITRYISYEGVMPIREGEKEKYFYSDNAFLSVFVDGNYQGNMMRQSMHKPLLLSEITNNHFKFTNKFDKTPFSITYKNFVMGAEQVIVPDEKGIKMLKLVESSSGTRNELFMEEGKVVSINNILIAYNKETSGAINIIEKDNDFFISSNFGGEYMVMANQSKGLVVKDSLQKLQFRSLYNIAGVQFVLPELPKKGKISYQSNKDWKDNQTTDALTVVVESDGKKEEVTLLGKNRMVGVPYSIKINDLEFTLQYGSRTYELPFEVKLNDFIAEKYPGTIDNYKAFESKVTILDGEKKNNFDARIFMNNVLDYRGYRFFQASYDPDEKGTTLSVNKDAWGSGITYFGYFLLYFGLMAILFSKASRFGQLKQKLDKLNAKKASLVMLLLPLFMFAQSDTTQVAQHNHAPKKKPSLAQIELFIEEGMPSKEHAAQFGELVIQDENGRMKPINTFASELLRKVSQSDKYKNYTADQVFLSMSQNPYFWMEIPIVKLQRGNDSIRKVLGVSADTKFVSFAQFFDEKGNYKIDGFLSKAQLKAIPNQFEKDFIEINKRVVLLNQAFSGAMLRILPVPNDSNNTWISYLQTNEVKEENIQKVKNIVPLYLSSLFEAKEKNDYKQANQLLEGMSIFQNKFGKKVIPSKNKIKAEILYNKVNIFNRLYQLDLIFGLLMLILAVAHILRPSKRLMLAQNIIHGIIWILFILHTLGLMVRWYISGHAPWSNAYESIIYVAWATLLFTLIFDRKAKLTVAAGTFVTAIVLWVASLSWVDPEIGNLVPVLDSYWLMIHVAVIVGSYGPFTLGMILGITSLVLMLFANEKNRDRLKINIQELTYINEMALTIGLVMLTIGNFLGGMWANESWGRYWGWDPKETWALISIMVYAFVIHMRFVPALRGLFVFNLWAIIAFGSIMMTYFGVNFYLSGLHSYASGERVVTPSFVYYAAIFIAVLGAFSYFKYKKHLRA
jgi:cytochrome c-type biogenesis protein CcsB